MLFIVVFYCYLTVNKVEYIINFSRHLRYPQQEYVVYKSFILVLFKIRNDPERSSKVILTTWFDRGHTILK